MATNKLTDALCKRAQPGPKPRKLADGGGMFLLVTPSGSKIFRMAYSLQGKEQTAVLGPYPLLSLADARLKRDEVKRKILDGVDLKAKPRESITFDQARELYWAGRKDVTPKYVHNAQAGLAMYLAPALGSKPLNTITRQMLLDGLMILDAQGKFPYARKVRLWASMVLAWAKEQGHCGENVADSINPKTAFGRKPVVSHASLPVSGIPGLFARLALENELQSVLACRMLALTWVRTGELRMMKWDEIEGSLWRVPGPTMKMGREHLVPLPKQALALLAKLKARSRGSVYVFPNDRRLDRPMSENSVLYLLGRVGYGGLMTGHGFRTVVSTWANERGYNPDAVEMALAHASGSAVRVIYNHAAYLPERKQMLQDWADWLDNPDTGIVQGGESPANALSTHVDVGLGKLALLEPAAKGL